MKMKEEKKFKKKENKFNNGHDSLSKNDTGDDGGLAEVKKKKKGKKVNAEVIHILEDVSRDGNSEKEEQKRIVSESLNDSNGSDVKNDKKLRKKKKKQLDNSENQLATAHGSKKEEEELRQPTKEKKVKKKSENVNVKTDEKEVPPSERDKCSKKAKKGKNNNVFVSKEETEGQPKKKKTTNEEITDVMARSSVKKKKNRAKMIVEIAENDVKTETSVGKTGEVNEIKKKQREKRKKEGEKEEMAQIKDGTLNMEKDDATECGTAIIEVEETKPKKKRKKKNSKGVKEKPLAHQCEEVEEQNRKMLVKGALDSTTKKRKKVFTEVETQVENVSSESGSKKKKKKIKHKVEDNNVESPQGDMDLSPEKSGNTDPVTIKQGFGQWSTAQFESSDQQQKFLRLMGGFKKSFQSAAGNTGRANMALGQNAQQQLQQGLLGEFEKAHSRRLDLSNRGAGLGFSAPSNKKFSIDINACRSVHFDD